jgi:hypothetical protein
MVSPFVSIVVVVADIGVAALLIAGMAYATRGERRPAVLWIGGPAVAVWFAATLVLAASGQYQTTPDTTLPPAIAFGIVVPAAILCALLAVPAARDALARLPLQWLVGVQSWRVVGGVFLVAAAQGDVPAEFALPAGIGDVLVGLAAPFIALTLARSGAERARTPVLIWCLLGIADLVVAVACGLLTSPSTVQQLALTNPNVAITSYPLVLIPLFAVPASIALHVWVLARLRRAPQVVAQARMA